MIWGLKCSMFEHVTPMLGAFLTHPNGCSNPNRFLRRFPEWIIIPYLMKPGSIVKNALKILHSLTVLYCFLFFFFAFQTSCVARKQGHLYLKVPPVNLDKKKQYSGPCTASTVQVELGCVVVKYLKSACRPVGTANILKCQLQVFCHRKSPQHPFSVEQLLLQRHGCINLKHLGWENYNANHVHVLCVLYTWIVCVCVCVDVVFPSPVEHTMHEYTHSYLTFRTLIHYSQSVDKALISTTQTFLKKNTASLCR